MEIPTDQRLLEEIEAFLSDMGMAPSRFGLEAMGDGALVRQLREGARSLSLKNAERVLTYIADRRSDGGGGASPPFPNPLPGTGQTAPEPDTTDTDKNKGTAHPDSMVASATSRTNSAASQPGSTTSRASERAKVAA